ncbi:MAG: hypothetical protein CBD47_08145 [Synechococcus sp. TMED187]|nr:hypothetical protein [Synechococcus sp. NAT40]OUW45667.1 MAG: hypothetical protein CBD47_08145 [Synechococcus sp. TMED187]RZO15473.1 MAG: hypothetical protein EVB08_00350 [Synechococcus sp. MED-G135]
MFTIERLNESWVSGEAWIPEIQYETEFKAFVCARTKCMATGRSYRVINPSHEVQCIITLEDCKKHFGLG